MENRVPDEKKIRRLITDLNDPSIDIRHQAVRVLGEIGKSATSPLIQVLADAKNNDHRWYAAVALSGIGEPAVAPLISQSGFIRRKNSDVLQPQLWEILAFRQLNQ